MTIKDDEALRQSILNSVRVSLNTSNVDMEVGGKSLLDEAKTEDGVAKEVKASIIRGWK